VTKTWNVSTAAAALAMTLMLPCVAHAQTQQGSFVSTPLVLVPPSPDAQAQPHQPRLDAHNPTSTKKAQARHSHKNILKALAGLLRGKN